MATKRGRQILDSSKNATTTQKIPQPPGPGDLLTIEFVWFFIGRSGGIRTHDPYTPSAGNRQCYVDFRPLFLIWISLNQVRYPGKRGNNMVTLRFVIATLSVSSVSISFFEY